MIDTSLCPPRDDLQRFLVGQLTDEEAVGLELHLASCSACVRALTALQPRDRLVDAVADVARSGRPPVEEVREELLRTLYRLPVDEVATDEGRVTRDQVAALDFLRPSERPDEIGRFGAYGILRILGVGGMGVVLAARQERPARVVALKVLAVGSSPGRFRSEAEIVARLRHPNFVPIYEVGEEHGRLYFTMEFAASGSLAQQLAVAPLAPRDATVLVEAIARAIAFAHEHHVVHRDLKPSNILRADDGRPLLADFGLAKLLDEEANDTLVQTHSGTVLGTPAYMAPEQAMAQHGTADPLMDVYALGAILYECLTGRPPFRAATALDTLDLVRTQEPVAPTRLQPGLPRDLQTIALKCLEKEPRRRYSSALELADDLGRFLRGEPIQARPATWLGRLQKWARRRPLVALLTAVCSLCVVALTVGGLVYENRLRQALSDAQAAGQRADDAAQAAQSQATRADAQYRQARDAVMNMLFRTKDPRWNAVPRLQQLRREQIQVALAFFDGVAAQPGESALVRADVAWACVEAGKLQLFLGRVKEGQTLLRRGLTEADNLNPAEVEEVPLGLMRAEALMALGVAAPGPAGLLDMERGVALLEDLRQRHPQGRGIRSVLVDSCITLGGAYVSHREYVKAERVLQLAVDLCNELLQQTPGDASKLAVRARARVNLCASYRQSKQREKTQAEHRLAEADLELLYARDPLARETIDGLAVLRLNGAYDLEAAGKRAEAVTYVQRNVPMLEKVLNLEPDDDGYRDRLHRTWGVTAMMLLGQGKSREAALAWERVVRYASAADKKHMSVTGVEFWVEARDHVQAGVAADLARQELERQPDAGQWSRLADLLERVAGLADADEKLPQSQRQMRAEQLRAAARTARDRARVKK